MVADVHKNPPPADQASAKPDVSDKAGTPAPVADHQPSALHADTHGQDALHHHRNFRLHAEKGQSGLPAVDVVDHAIKSDGSAQSYHVKPGDTLSDIAKRQLPPGSSVHDIYNHVKEIAQANGIANPDKIRAGIDLKLPEKAAPAHHDAPKPPAGNGSPHSGDKPPGTPPAAGDTPPAARPPAAGDTPPAARPPAAGDTPPAARPPAGDAPPAAEPPADAPAGPAAPKPGADQPAPAAPKPGDQAPVLAPTAEQKAALTATTVTALENALGEDNPTPPPMVGDGIYMPTGPITDSHKILELLKDKSPDEIKAISDAFAQKYGSNHGNRPLEAILKDRMSGTDQSQAVDLFHRGDKADDAGRVHTAMQEMHQFFEGRSSANCQKDIRDTLATMNSQQINDFKKDYENRYNEKFDDVIAKDTSISPETKKALAIYEKGSDHRTPQDTLDLADLAIQAKSLDMFQEAFRGASAEARTAYMAQGGEAKMHKAFGGTFSDSDVDKARNYVTTGKLDTVTNVKDNTGIFSSNDTAIDNTIKAMSPAEREQYDRGKAVGATFPEYVHHGRSTSFNTEAYNKLPPDQKQDYDKYRALHSSLTGAGGQAKVARWEDMISHAGNETLVTQLAQHGGVYTDKVDKALTDIEGMKKDDFDRLKTDPSYRKEVDAALALNYSGDDLKRAEALLNTKLAHTSFEQGGQTDGARGVLQSIDDKSGFWSTDNKGIVHAIQNMSPAEQKQYRDDPKFKKDLDAAVRSDLTTLPEIMAANRALERVSKGQPAQEDVIDKLSGHLMGSRDTATMLSEVEASFKQDPGLRERLLHPDPKNPDQVADAAKFDQLAHECFGSDYKKYVEPLVQKGNIPFQDRADLYKGFWSNDTKSLYDAIASASPEEQRALAADPHKMLPFLTPQQSELAGTIAGQHGQMRPEDQMRAAVLGMSGDKDTIKDLGANLKPEERALLVRNYELKYHTNLISDLDDKLSGQARTEAERNFRDLPDTARAAFNTARDEEYRSNDGIGRAFVRNTWDGTSDMSRDQLNQYAAQMEGYSRVYKDMPVAKSEQMATDLTQAVDLYRKSKGAAADAVVDGTIIVAGVGGAAFTGGVSLGLIATTGLAGAAFKIGTKATIMGADYDSSQIAVDGATGAIDAATMVVGPGEVAKILQIGGKAATVAGETAIVEAAAIAAKAGGRQILCEEAEATLSRTLTNDVSTALAHGAKEIDAKTMQSLAEKYAATPADVPAVKELLTKSLNQAIATESSNALKATLREVALNSGAGAGAGGGSALVRGVAGWDSSKSVNENLAAIGEQTAMGMGMGAAMGGGASLGFKVLGKGFTAARSALAEHLGPSVEGHLAPHEMPTVPDHVKLNPAGQVAEIRSTDGIGATQVDYHGKGPLQGEARSVKLPDGTRYENLGDNKLRLTNSENPNGITIKGDVAVNTKGEVQVNLANGDRQTYFPDRTSTVRKGESGDLVSLGPDGKVLAVKTRSGHMAAYGYGDDGHFMGVQDQNGRSVLSDDGGKTWNITEKNGATPTKFEGQVTLDDSGAVHLKPADGPERVLRPDGSSSHIDPASGMPADVTYPNGEVRKFGYDANGELNRYTDRRGVEMVRGEGNMADVWSHTDKSTGQTEHQYIQMSVSRDGALTRENGRTSYVNYTDGRILETNLKTNTPIKETLPEGYARDGQTRSSDGRLLADNAPRREYVTDNFEIKRGNQNGDSIKAVEQELRDVKAIGPDGKPTSAYDSLIKDPTLSDAQKQNILVNMAQVREHFASFRLGDRMHPDPEVNWIHTQGEIAKVLEAGRAKNLSPTELEDSVLASMYSDSVKFAFPPPEGAAANFFTHHLDGALAAEENLARQGFPPERVERIVEAIKAHQIAPPQFMGELYHGAVGRGIDAALKDNKITAEEAAHFKDVLKNMSEVGADGKTRIKAIADINNAPRMVDAKGDMEVAFTDEERRVLAFSGTDRWATPYDPKLEPNFRQLSAAAQTEALSRQRIAQTLIDGDGIDNYATTGGASKIVAIRGPGTGFKDGQVWNSITSVDSSFNDAYAVMSPEARRIADANLQIRRAVTDSQSGPIKSEMDAWLVSQGRDPSKPIPYYNTDLKYPDSYTLKPGEKNLPGLNDQQMEDYKFAQDIRAKMTDLLRRDHRVDGTLPGNFEAASGNARYERDLKFGDTKPVDLTLPGTKPQDIKPGETFTSLDGKVIAARDASDGSLAVTNHVDNSFRRYDSQNRILESTAANNNRQFHYGPDGQLSEVSTTSLINGEKSVLTRSADGKGWTEKYTGPDGKVTETAKPGTQVLVDADGTVKSYNKVEMSREQMERYNSDGSVDLVKPTGRVDSLRANYAQERQGLDKALSRDLAGNPPRLARVQELIKQFETNASSAERNLSQNDRALLYKQINRLLADSTATMIPLADRVNLAEQVLDHSAHPWHVDQGANSTCNVTTLEHRNYWRDPDKNAQVIADIATTGRYQFADGRTVDLHDVNGEIKPDYEAKRNLQRQAEGAPLKKGSLKADGERDYSSQLLETTMVNYEWANKTEVVNMDGKILKTEDYSMRYDSKGKPVGVVGPEHVTILRDANGGPVMEFKPGEQYYDGDKRPIPSVPQERLLFDIDGRAYGIVDKMDNVKMVYDSHGQPMTSVGQLGAPGDQAYDAQGRLMFAHTRAGDMHYEKVPKGPTDSERIMLDLNGKTIPLTDKYGKVISSPKLGAGDLLAISDGVTGLKEKPFVLSSDKLSGWNAVRVASSEDMVKALKQLDADHSLPAVMMVNSSKPPFNLPETFNAQGEFDGWHVINVQGIQEVRDEATGEMKQMIRFTNQWGSAADHLDAGMDAKTLFESMQPTPAKPPKLPDLPKDSSGGLWNRFKRWFSK